ncbi:MAG TPA: hypothetical protein VMI94_19890 [Bryobacteraceae bacterium]|nr:hypothetical protein [Bryobacteraceae bacterium]
MVNDAMQLQSAEFELATFGEVLYAFSTLRSTSNRRRGTRVTGEMLPWDENLLSAAAEREAQKVPPRAPASAQPRMHPAALERPARTRRVSGRCTCGQCRNCLENARWERIFQEKFANADYYHHDIRIRYASPLSSV